jgi:hypothetical protein
MQQFIGGAKCRRVVLDKQMDGRTDRVRCEAGEERCNVCQEGPSGVKRNRNRESIGETEKREAEKREVEKREVERREAERIFKEEEQRYRVVRAERMRERVEIEKAKTEEIEEVFQDWMDRCMICKAEGREEQEGSSSKWIGCSIKHKNKRGFEKTWRGLEEVEFERFSGCIKCWAPQEICHS